MHSRLDLATAQRKRDRVDLAAEAAESHPAVRAACLFAVLLVAKTIALAGRDVSLSPLALSAWIWQDLLIVLVFFVSDWLTNRPRFAWTVYGMIVAYSAINVPIVRVLSTPLTRPMLRATSGTLADSIGHHLTWLNSTLMLLIVLAGIALPFVVRRINPRYLRIAGLVALLLIPIGAWAVARVETNGLHRNPLVALVTTSIPRVSPQAANDDWRRSPFPQPDCELLTHLRGSATGCNVVLIVLESVGASYLKPYGATVDPMPTLTQIARRGILFENAYTSYPESIKGLIAVLSSVEPALDTQAEQYADVGRNSLAAELRRADYRTGLFHSGRFMYLGMNHVIRNRGFDLLEDAGDISGEHNSSFGVDEPSTVKRILNWIDAGPEDSPFFVTYMPIAGHHPYHTPEAGPFPEEREIDRYRNALHYSDAAIGRLVDGLKQRNLDRNTLLVVIGDHGQAFGQHDGNYGHTFFLYDENVRVPFIIVPPNMAGPVRIRRVASAVDVAPTILDLLGKNVPVSFQGASLLLPTQRMALFFTDYSLAILGLRDGRWKFLHEIESGRSKLFDLNDDPGETRNLADEYPDRVAAYRKRLKRWSAARRADVLNRD